MGLYGHRFTALLYLIFYPGFQVCRRTWRERASRTDLMIGWVRIGSKENIWLCLFGLLANQPVVLFSQTKSAPATSYQPVSGTVLS